MEITKNEKELATASAGHVEDSAVLSANVNDVLVQERLSPWSLIAFRLYGVIAITTLSKESRDTSELLREIERDPIADENRLHDEWV